MVYFGINLKNNIMILAFETGKWIADNLLKHMMGSIQGKYCQYIRQVPDDQNRQPLPPEINNNWTELQQDLIDNKATSYVFYGFMRGVDKIYKQALKRNIDFYFIDHPYFFRRQVIRSGITSNTNKSIYRRLVKNDFNISKITDTNSDKFNLFKSIDNDKFKLEKWKKSGKYILIFPPSVWMCRVLGIDHQKLLENTITEIKKYTDREILIRYKKPGGTDNKVPLKSQLDNAWAVVSLQSNAANEAIMYGIPSFTIYDKYSSAVPMSLQDLSKIETPFYPDNRYEWLCNLCNHMFPTTEISSGKALRYINEQ